jgi:hypothetical protein
MASHCFGSLDWAWLLISPHQGKEIYENEWKEMSSYS